MIGAAAKLIIELAGTLLKLATSDKTEEQILEELAAAVAETATAIAALPARQAARWKELADALKPNG
jgi:hypothetical protein